MQRAGVGGELCEWSWKGGTEQTADTPTHTKQRLHVLEHGLVVLRPKSVSDRS